MPVFYLSLTIQYNDGGSIIFQVWSIWTQSYLAVRGQVLQALVRVEDLPLLIGVLVVDRGQAERRLERHLAAIFSRNGFVAKSTLDE